MIGGVIRGTLRAAVNGVVAAESAVLERVPRSLDGVGAPIIVATHRRSGTHLTIDTLRRNFVECRPRMLPLENQHNAYLDIDALETGHKHPKTQREAIRLLAKAPRPTVKTHAEPGFPHARPADAAFVRDVAARSGVLYISRDGLKVMVSLWVWRRGFDPEARVPFDAFLRQTDGQGRTRPRVWNDHVLRWLAEPGVVHYRFDELVKQTPRVLGELAERFGLSLDAQEPMIPPPVRSRAEALAARARGDLTSTNQHPSGQRTPAPGEVFGPEDLALFEREAGEAQALVGG